LFVLISARLAHHARLGARVRIERARRACRRHCRSHRAEGPTRAGHTLADAAHDSQRRILVRAARTWQWGRGARRTVVAQHALLAVCLAQAILVRAARTNEADLSACIRVERPWRTKEHAVSRLSSMRSLRDSPNMRLHSAGRECWSMSLQDTAAAQQHPIRNSHHQSTACKPSPPTRLGRYPQRSQRTWAAWLHR
jgi:hypothetical protein